MEEYHKPVLLQKVLEALRVENGKWYVDATLGDGGHSLAILKLGGNVAGIDVDSEALKRTEERFGRLGKLERFGKFRLIQGNFRHLKSLIQKADVADKGIKCVLFDLGVSSLQLESAERGFSFSKDAPLDMRMDPSLAVTAADLLKVIKKGELSELFSNLGEEKFSRAISDTLVSAREVEVKSEKLKVKSFEIIKTTKQLANLVEDVYRKHGIKKWRIHPATRVFQALRIVVNDELNALREALPQALDILSKDGRIVVISFHSLEDRIVKNTFKDWEKQGLGMVVTKKPIPPSYDEVMRNKRSRSAKMRVFEKL